MGEAEELYLKQTENFKNKSIFFVKLLYKLKQ